MKDRIILTRLTSIHKDEWFFNVRWFGFVCSTLLAHALMCRENLFGNHFSLKVSVFFQTCEWYTVSDAEQRTVERKTYSNGFIFDKLCLNMIWEMNNYTTTLRQMKIQFEVIRISGPVHTEYMYWWCRICIFTYIYNKS